MQLYPLETFETGSLSGWRNGRIESSTAFTKFLGRFAKDDPDPWKYYRNIPTNALFLILEFDFYEIDSWNLRDQDCLYVLIDGKRVNLGIFDQNRDDGPRSGSSEGISWNIGDSAVPRNIGFSGSKDQIHHVTMRIPKSYFSDGRVKLQFDTRVSSSNRHNESSGFDNIKWVAHFDCPNAPTPSPTGRPTPNPLPCPNPRYFPTETFSRSTHGWRNARRDSNGGFGRFMGRYARNDPIPYKDYRDIPRHVDKVRFMVDFYEIDSWDNTRPRGPDCVYIWVDNTKLFIGYFGSSINERNRSGRKDGIRWESSALGAPRQIGFGRAYDQKHRIKVYIPPSFYADGKIRVRLQTVVNGNINNESAGWDNIRLAYLYFCRRRLGGGLVGSNEGGSHLRKQSLVGAEQFKLAGVDDESNGDDDIENWIRSTEAEEEPLVELEEEEEEYDPIDEFGATEETVDREEDDHAEEETGFGRIMRGLLW